MKKSQSKPPLYIFEISNISSKEALDNLRIIINDDYFGDYSLGEGRIFAEGLRADIGGFSIEGRMKKVKDMKGVLSAIISHARLKESNFLEAMLNIQPSSEIKTKLGFSEEKKRGSDLRLPLDIFIKYTDFRVYNLGLDKSDYEDMHLMGLYRKDRIALLKWYEEIDTRLKEILPYQC